MNQKSYDGSPIVYLIPTPIGNMEDITIRALNILKETDIIFSEDTRVTKQLLDYYNIPSKKLISSHLFNEENNKDTLIKYLKEGKKISIVSDRGTPVISDPGFLLARHAIENNYNVVCLPGPTAFVPAFVMSALGDRFLFYGFLNSKESKRKTELEELKQQKYPIVFYEAPHRISKTLKTIKEIFGNRKAVIAREISKKYEEILRGDIEYLIKETEDIKGEIVLIVDGNKEEKDFSSLSVIDHINIYLKEGKTSKEAIKLVAKDRNEKKGDIYNQYHRR